MLIIVQVSVLRTECGGYCNYRIGVDLVTFLANKLAINTTIINPNFYIHDRV